MDVADDLGDFFCTRTEVVQGRRLLNQRQAYKSDRSVLAVKRNQEDVQLTVLEMVTEIVERKQEKPLHFDGTHERR